MRFYSPQEEAHFLEVESFENYRQRTDLDYSRVLPLIKELGGIPPPRRMAGSESEEEEEEESAEGDESEEDTLVGALFDDSCSAHDESQESQEWAWGEDVDVDDGEVEYDAWP